MELLQRAPRRHQDDERDEAALLWGEDGRAGIVHPGEEKLWDDLIVAFQDLKELQERWRETVSMGLEGQDKGNGFTLPESRVRLDIRKKFFPVSVGRPWHRVPREAVAVPSLEMSKARLERALSNLEQ
ncbi:hypothetical protein WISP_66357 [Willisornis vidua]|uniref:Uncharacterized protein n=1 Tax=Willisornis vidua TaxID=1566151 RepID=A0ABQ9D9H1_9PASS|nr:hypothetical protein WISP_66357 [Willisornis vidua]